LKENPHSNEIDDCFTEHISMINTWVETHKSDPKYDGRKYFKPDIKWETSVIREQAKDVVENTISTIQDVVNDMAENFKDKKKNKKKTSR
jgi:hypothetical protein